VNFCSDNVAGAAPEIVAALANASTGSAMPYGADEWMARVAGRLAEIFEREVAVFAVATGTAANSLALATLCPPWGAVYCHDEAHINVDECGAPEMFTAGAKLVALPGPHGKLEAATVEQALANGHRGVVHRVQPAALSLSQATESGTVYTPAEIGAMAEIARRHGIGLHMDGARFANALVHLGCTPAELTWRSGVDVLSLGATKNGALAAEAVVFFDPARAADFAFRRKRAGHLFSKMRFLAAQLDAYLADGLWLRLARHANALAARLAGGLAGVPGVALLHPVEANEVFVTMPAPMQDALRAAGFQFYGWPDGSVRLVTAFDGRAADIDRFLAVARENSAAAA